MFAVCFFWTGGAALTLAINFFGLKALSEGVVTKSERAAALLPWLNGGITGAWKNTQRASSDGEIKWLFQSLANSMKDFAITQWTRYPFQKKYSLVWTMRPAYHRGCLIHEIRVNAVSRVQSKHLNSDTISPVLGDQSVQFWCGFGRSCGHTRRTLRRLFFILAFRRARWSKWQQSQRMVDWNACRDSRKRLVYGQNVTFTSIIVYKI